MLVNVRNRRSPDRNCICLADRHASFGQHVAVSERRHLFDDTPESDPSGAPHGPSPVWPAVLPLLSHMLPGSIRCRIPRLPTPFFCSPRRLSLRRFSPVSFWVRASAGKLGWLSPSRWAGSLSWCLVTQDRPHTGGFGGSGGGAWFCRIHDPAAPGQIQRHDAGCSALWAVKHSNHGIALRSRASHFPFNSMIMQFRQHWEFSRWGWGCCCSRLARESCQRRL